MSKKFRKVLAAVLAATMVLGSGVVANAAEGSGEGSGSLDIVEKSDIFDVVLPTSSGTQFNYILDPTNVIGLTDGTKYASASFVENKTMYFRNKPATEGGVATYSDVSDPITAYNMGTMDVEIKVEANVATPSGMEISPSYHTALSGSAAAATATPSIYLGVMASGSTPAASTPITTTKGIVATKSIADAADRYIVVATGSESNKVYKKVLDATGSNAKGLGYDAGFGGVFKSYSFMLTGSCNADGKWEGLTETPPTVSLVWTIENPSTSGPQMTLSSTGYITITGLTADQNYGSLDIDYDEGNIAVGEGTVWDTDSYDAATGGNLGIQLSDAWRSWLAGQTITVNLTLTDGSTVSATATLDR